MGVRARIILLAGLLATAGIIASPAGGEMPVIQTDPQFTPVTGPAETLPDQTLPGAQREVHLSRLPDGRVPGPGRKTGTYTARLLTRTVVRHRPGGRVVWVARAYTEWSGGPQQLMVLRSRQVSGRMWLKVRLPIRPNGSTGWLPRDRVILGHTPGYLVINRSRRRLTVYGRHGKVKARFRVVVGSPDTPTPVGLFALYDRVRQADPRGFIGPWALPLTAHSNRLRKYDGGPGLVALHGRDGASLLDPLGSARSHGCVRMNNRRIRMILRLGLGTAVRIRR